MRSRLSKMDHETGFADDFFGSIPEGFVAKALSLTSPLDACRLSSVCSVFRSAAEWDAVWESFLPPDYRKIIAQTAEDGGCSFSFCSKKQLYLRLCDHPIVIDGGNKSFWLDKETGKKCYMLAARDLSIIWVDTPRYWRWISLPESRFAEVAELISVCWFEVHGKISTTMLSPNTVYVAFMVFKSTPEIHGFEYQPAEVSVGIDGHESCQTRTVFLDPEDETTRRCREVGRRRIGMFHRGYASTYIMNPNINPNPKPRRTNGSGPREREDGWLEIELGEYMIKEGEGEDELVMSMTEVKGRNWKGGIVIQGIEIRPKPPLLLK